MSFPGLAGWRASGKGAEHHNAYASTKVRKTVDTTPWFWPTLRPGPFPYLPDWLTLENLPL